jgi:hypothetical protein
VAPKLKYSSNMLNHPTKKIYRTDWLRPLALFLLLWPSTRTHMSKLLLPLALIGEILHWSVSLSLPPSSPYYGGRCALDLRHPPPHIEHGVHSSVEICSQRRRPLAHPVTPSTLLAPLPRSRSIFPWLCPHPALSPRPPHTSLCFFEFVCCCNLCNIQSRLYSLS